MEYRQPIAGEPSAGTLHFLPFSKREAKLVSITGYGWYEVDFSAKVPTGTKAVLAFFDAQDTDGQGILLAHGDDSENAYNTDIWPECAMIIFKSATLSGGSRVGAQGIVQAPEGIFYIAQYPDSSWDISVAEITIQGYYR